MLGLDAGTASGWLAQSVFAAHAELGAVVTVAVAADCCASGIVASTLGPIDCSAESERSAAVAVVLVLVVVIGTVIVAGAAAAVIGTAPKESPGLTLVITVAAYSFPVPSIAATTTS